MSKGFFQVPVAVNEPVKSYAPGSPEREEVLQQYRKYFKSKTEVPLYIGEHEITLGDTRPISPPHDRKHIVGHAYLAEAEQVDAAIESALEARSAWAALTWEQRAAIFLKAAELLAGPYRARQYPRASCHGA